MSIDRIRHTVSLVGADGDIAVEKIAEDPVNRWASFELPALAERAAGADCDHPGLYDGWRTQVFTEAAVASAKRGTWVELAEMDAEA